MRLLWLLLSLLGNNISSVSSHSDLASIQTGFMGQAGADQGVDGLLTLCRQVLKEFINTTR